MPPGDREVFMERAPLSGRAASQGACAIEPFPKGGDLREALRDALARYADRTALVTDRTRWTYAETGDRVRRLANLFDSLSVGPDDFIGAVLSPRPEVFIELFLAKAEHGAALFGLSPLLPPDAMAQALVSARPKVVVYDAGLMPRFPELLRRVLPESRALAARNGADEWEGLLGGAPAGPIRRPVPAAGLSTVGYTSGTTGAPKGVAMGHAAAAECARRFTEVLAAVFGDDEPRGFLTGIPVFAAGSGTIVPALLAGMTNFVPDRFSAGGSLRLIRESRIGAAFVTPSMLIDLLDEEDLEESTRGLEVLIYGSANTPVPKIEEAVRRLGPKLLQGYGMSELLPPVAVLWPEEHGTRERPAAREILGSTGLPYDGVRVRIEDVAGRGLPAEEVGEIVISSSTCATGYWKDPARTAESLRDGWWRSSDAGFLDARGRLHVIDRLKDVMTRGGRSVYPRRIEEACCDHPMVKEAAAVQMPESERLVIAISVRREHRASLEPERLRGELLHHLVDRLDPAELPDVVEIFPELPRSLQGKVLKREVRDALAARRA
jgi:acyl-CoA synthetase (AMP-forming)/AMP-acid ligase II